MLKDDDWRISFRFAPYLAWTSLVHLSRGKSFIGDEEFVILVAFRAKKNPGFSFPYEANQEFDFDENLSQTVSPDSMCRIHDWKIY